MRKADRAGGGHRRLRRVLLLSLLAWLRAGRLGGAPLEPGAAPVTATTEPAPATDPPVQPKKDFVAALLEVTAFNVLPQLWNRLVLRKEMGMVTLETWRDNIRHGFAYDPDKFVTNMLSHPQHGGLYYGAARANGFDLYESALFTAFGSLTWEYFGEASRPSTNDLINTTIGGISAGETSYRLADLVFDDTATGTSRFLHELAGLAISPGRTFQRLLSGEAWRVAPNPASRRPEWLGADLLGGGLLVSSRRPGTSTTTSGRGTVGWDVRYGDPFEKDLGRPFSTFRLSGEVTTAKNFLSRLESEGNLSGWRLDESVGDRTVVAATLGFTYQHVDLSFGAQTLGFELSERIPAGGRWDLVPRLQALSAYAAVQTSEESVKATYRNYDWGLGGGFAAGARLRRDAREVARLGYTDLWLLTVNGPTRWNEVRIGEAAAFVPVSARLSAGASYTFHQHRNVFAAGTQRRTSQQLRLLVSWSVISGKP